MAKKVAAQPEDEGKVKNTRVWENLTDLEKMVLGKLVSETLNDDLRDSVAKTHKQGETYPIDFTIEVSGLLSLGKDNLCPCQFRLPIKKILAKLASKLNTATVEATLRELVEDIQAGREIDVEPVERAIKAAESLVAVTTEIRRGKVNLDVVVKKVEKAKTGSLFDLAKES
jgi:hypothetical protein